MNAAFDFVSHESFPEDEYTKEAVVLCIDKKHRITYVRKKLQTGAMFWDIVSVAVKKDGVKKYLKAYSQDSSFLADDIKTFLENRSWEAARSVTTNTYQQEDFLVRAQNLGSNNSPKDEEVPF